MRISASLCYPQRIRRLRDASWNRWRKRTIKDPGIEASLKELGIKIVDANEYLEQKIHTPWIMNSKQLSDPEPIFTQPPNRDRFHPDWKELPLKQFSTESFPILGLNQALVFSNSVIIEPDLPKGVTTQKELFEENDDGILRCVKKSFLWDSYLEKLPKLRDLDFPTRNWERQFGIPLKRSCELLCRLWLRRIEQKIPSIARERMILESEPFRVNCVRHGSKVQFDLQPLLTVVSKKSLPRIVEDDIVRSTSSMNLPNIEPFLSTSSMQNVHVYRNEDTFPLNHTSKFKHSHLSIFCHDIPGSHTHIHPRWNDDRFKGASILYAFANSLMQARINHGENVEGVLKEPVISQTIVTTGKEFQFVVFQLNNLDLDTEQSDVKNIVWVTEKLPLFEKCAYIRGQDVLEGYNHDIFSKFSAMYQYGSL